MAWTGGRIAVASLLSQVRSAESRTYGEAAFQGIWILVIMFAMRDIIRFPLPFGPRARVSFCPRPG